MSTSSDFIKGAKVVLGGISGLILVGAAVVVIWASFGLPQVAWSTDINRLDRQQVRLAVDFQRERSINLFQRVVYVRGELTNETSKPKAIQNMKYILMLKGQAETLVNQVEQTDANVLELEKRALHLESK